MNLVLRIITSHGEVGDEEIEPGLLVPDEPDGDEDDAVADHDEGEKNPEDGELDVLIEEEKSNMFGFIRFQLA